MITKTVMGLSGCAVLLLTACGVKDPIFNTPHPGHGMVTLTTEWSGIGEGLTPPASYTVKAALNGSDNPSATAGYSATLTGITNKLDHLFEPGNYRFYVYNTPEQITVNGTVASVAGEEAVTPMNAGGTALGANSADDPERFLHSTPGWLFTCTLDVAIAADTEQSLTAPMRQQVRQLTLLVEPTGETADKVESIMGTLSGVAGTLDIADDSYGMPSNVGLTFSKITEGTNAGKWSATVRLLGVTGGEQRLAGMISFIDNNPGYVFLDSDLTAALAAFNTDKSKPLTLDGKVVETPTGADIGATITDWETVTGGSVVAD